MHRNKHRDLKKMKKKRNMFQKNQINKNKKQDEIPGTDLNEMEISDLPDRDFKIMVTKMDTEVKMKKVRILAQI